MGRPDYIFGQFRETARCRDAQHGDGVCCAFAPHLVVFCRMNWRVVKLDRQKTLCFYGVRRRLKGKQNNFPVLLLSTTGD